MDAEYISVHERLAVQEEQIDHLESKVQELSNKVDEVLSSLTRYKGFIGGIIFVMTCIGAFLKLLPVNLGFFQK